ncbi:MAG: glutamine amidotransferase [Pseudomonadota bacterium]
MQKLLLIDHPVSERRDRASAHLKAIGRDLTWCCPGRGETLPDPKGFEGLIVYGGAEMLSTDLDQPDKAYLRQEVDYVAGWLASEKPFLGFCLGGQIMSLALGGAVGPHPEGINQIGYYEIEATATGREFLPEPLAMYQWHQEGFSLPDGVDRIATGPDFPNQAIRRGKAYGLQFHPEVGAEQYRYWIQEVPDALTRPGAQAAEEQLALAPELDPITERWLDGFLDHWTRL